MIAALFGRIGLKGILLGLAALAIVSAVGAFYMHYQGLVRDNATLTANNAQLTTSLDLERKANAAAVARIGEFAQALDRQQATMEQFAKMTEEASRTIRRINDVFSSHDFQNLLNKKPGLIVRRVNDGTRDTLRMFECATRPGGRCRAEAAPADGKPTP